MSTYKDILRSQLRIDEAVRTKPYRDSVGKLSIGVGRNLDDVGVRPDEIALMMENDIAQAEHDARTLVRNFDDLSEARQAAIVNMFFNMGLTKMAKFVNTLRAVNEGRFGDAADGMLDSLWARQVGDRAKRLAKAMRDG